MARRIKLKVEAPEDKIEVTPVPEEPKKQDAPKTSDGQKPEPESKPADPPEKSVVADKTSYEPTDLLKAPIEPPVPKDRRKPDEVQIGVIVIGIILAVIGIILWIVLNASVLAIVAVIGAALVVVGTLTRPKPQS